MRFMSCQANGQVIKGQNAISHPAVSTTPGEAGTVEKYNSGPPMEAPVKRIFYLSSEGTHQVGRASPRPSSHVLCRNASAS